MTKPPESIGAILGRTAWDYSPEDASVGLLSPMSRFFRGFPWEGWRGGEEQTTRLSDGEDPLAVDDVEDS